MLDLPYQQEPLTTTHQHSTFTTLEGESPLSIEAGRFQTSWEQRVI